LLDSPAFQFSWSMVANVAVFSAIFTFCAAFAYMKIIERK